MAVTNYIDTGFKVGAIQARTDPAGAPLVDVDGEELRLYGDILTVGVIGIDDFFVEAGAGLSVDVGSDVEKSDVAVVGGSVAGQGNYLVRLELGNVNVPLTASDLTNPRIDEVYLVVEDDPYDSSTRALPRLSVRQGDFAASPIAPGPDPSWSASMLLATVEIDAGATGVIPNDITDHRVDAGLAIQIHAADIGGTPVEDFDAHLADVANPHNVTADQTDAYAKDETYTDDEVDDLLSGKAATHSHPYAATAHTHSGTDITSGVVSEARLPNASTSAQGVVKLTTSVSSTSTSLAPTASALKSAYDKGNHSHPYASSSHDHGRYYYAGSTSAVRKITISTGAPSGGSDGDIWFQY